MASLKNKIDEVVVVEGYHDLAKLKAIYEDIDVYITNGSEVSDNTLNELKILNESRGLILLLDPDFQGERIRRIINDFVGPTKHAFLNKKDCINKNKTKVGIEHANCEKIRTALESFLTVKKDIKSMITMSDMYQLNLIGKPNSKHYRLVLGEGLGIGSNNGKTLLNKLNMFGIKIEQINSILRK
jgi:ribonuclease M5